MFKKKVHRLALTHMTFLKFLTLWTFFMEDVLALWTFFTLTHVSRAKSHGLGQINTSPLQPKSGAPKPHSDRTQKEQENETS